MKNPLISPCTAWAKKLSATHPDDLSPAEQTALLTHLEKCPACATIRFEYQLIDSRIRSYPANGRLFPSSKRGIIPEYEFHRLRLLQRQQAKRNHGILLIVVGILFFLLALIHFIPLFPHYQGGLTLVLVDMAGIIIPIHFFWKGLVSVFASLQPIAIEEVKQQRQLVRRVSYLQARGELLPDHTLGSNTKTFVIESSWIVSGGFILLLHTLNSISGQSWGYILLFTVIGLMECLLILDAFYLAPKRSSEIPVQSVQELLRRFIDGEVMTGEESREQPQEEE